MNMNAIKKTRAERKAARNESFKRMEEIQRKQKEIRAEYERKHPVTCGLILIVEYVAPH